MEGSLQRLPLTSNIESAICLIMDVCYVCGSEENLETFENIVIKTEGFDVPVKECKICDDPKCREKIK